MINKKATNQKNIKIVQSFKKGLNNFIERNKIEDDELSVAENVVLIDKGAPQARGGVTKVGNYTFPFTPYLLANYRPQNGNYELLVGETQQIRRFDGLDWAPYTTVPSYTGTAQYSYTMYRDKMYIVNGVNPMVVYNGSTFYHFNAITAPTGLTISMGSGLSTGSYTYSYRVTAYNDIGETESSVPITISVNKRREEWNFNPNNPNPAFSITISWSAVTGATGYNIYGVKSGKETYLDNVSVGTSYTDYGLKEPSLLFIAPSGNTTQAPLGKYITVYNGSIIIAGDPNNPSRLYYSAGVDKPESFSIGDGGGYIDIQGTEDDGVITGLYVFQNQLIVFKERGIWSFKFTETAPVVNNIAKDKGCVNHWAIAQVENDLFFVGSKGNGIALYSLGYEPNFQNVLRTAEISIRVRKLIDNVNPAGYKDICMVYHGGKVLISYPEGGSSITPNKILVYDRERAAFSVWNDISAKQMQLVWDANKKPRLMYIKPTLPRRIEEYIPTGNSDNGEAIKWKYRTKDFDMNLPFDIKRLYWVQLSFLQGAKQVKIIIHLDDETYETNVNITPALINTVLGKGRLGQARLGITNLTDLQYNTFVRIPIHRLGTQSLVRRFGVEIQGNELGSTGALQNLEFIYKLLNAKTNTLDEVIQI